MYKKLHFIFALLWMSFSFAQTSSIQLTSVTPEILCATGKDTVIFSVNYSGIPANSNIVFYRSTNPSFNPYLGQGDSIGFINVGSNTSSGMQVITECPEIIGIFIDACDPDPLLEQDNEYIIITSGKGFLVNNLQVDVPSTANKDINIPLGSNLFGTPSAGLINQLRIGSCDASNLFAAGPGDSIPPNAIVFIFPSKPLAGGNVYAYNFSSYCSSGQPIYILQNSYHQPNGSFANNAPNSCPGTGSRSTIVKNRTCTSTLTYDACSLPKFNASNPNANDGSFVVKVAGGAMSSTTNGGIKNNAADICNGLRFDSIVGSTIIKFPIPNDGTSNPATDFCNKDNYIKAITNPKGSQPISNTLQFQLVCLDIATDVNSLSICSDSNAVIKISSSDPNASFSWTVSGGINISGANAGSGTIINQKLTYTGSTKDSVVYTITAKDNKCSISKNIKVVVGQCDCSIPFSFGTTTTSICSGNSISLNAGDGYDKYKWNTGATTQSITITQPGKYWVDVLKNGCKGSDSIQVIKVDKPIKPNLGADASYCGAFTHTLTTGNAQTDWFKDQVLVASGASYTAKEQGTYIAKISNSCGSAADTIVITVNNIMKVELGNDTTICSGKSVTLNATVAGSGITYLWNTGEKTSTISVNKAGAYNVVVTKGICVAYDTIKVDVVSSPQKPTLGKDTTFCGNFSYNLSTGDNNTVWNTGASGSTITAIHAGTYIAEIKNQCGSAKDTVVLSQHSLPKVDLGRDTTICDSIQLSVGNGKYVSVAWSTGEVGTSIIVRSTGNYKVIVADINCKNSDSILIKKECNYDAYIPSAFSPNHDGINDVLVPLSNVNGMQIIDFLIYNRWGEKVFEAQDFVPNDISKGWDGMYKGENAQVDNYAYYCSVRMPDNQIKVYKGTVALLR